MSNQPENQPQPSVAKLALADLPLRDELRGEEAYGAPQLDVDVRLNTNENPYPPSDDLIADLVAQVEKVASDLNRYPDRDAVALRSALADYVTRQTGVDITVDQVWAANGSNEILQQLLQAFGGPGRSAMGFVPSYSMHPILSSGTQTEFIGIARDPETFDIDMDSALAAIAEHRPDVIFITTPNNPTGNLTTLADLRRIIEAAPGIVIVDEAYAEFRRPGVPSALELVGPDNPHLAVTRTMSKAFGAAGLRLGYLAADRALVDALRVVRLPYHLSAVTQAAALAALSHRDELMAQVASLRDERDAFVDWLRTQGLSAHESDANFVLFGPFPDRKAVWQALLDAGVLIRVVGPEGFLRASVGTPEEMARLRAALTSAIGR